MNLAQILLSMIYPIEHGKLWVRKRVFHKGYQLMKLVSGFPTILTEAKFEILYEIDTIEEVEILCHQ